MHRVARIAGAAQFGHPHLHPVAGEDRHQAEELFAVERPLTLADHDRIEGAVGIGKGGKNFAGLRTLRPRQPSGVPDIKELGDDAAVAGDQFG
jgi:hypothetical protein